MARSFQALDVIRKDDAWKKVDEIKRTLVKKGMRSLEGRNNSGLRGEKQIAKSHLG
jgi:hypothetical protein